MSFVVNLVPDAIPNIKNAIPNIKKYKKHAQSTLHAAKGVPRNVVRIPVPWIT